mmetsp:Transcript_45378/g.109912  ORF Transcript_45378/g.109912 Transcript_45378/m.109912 type:complete len:636 (+) Transcript_45378:195-2102(+)
MTEGIGVMSTSFSEGPVFEDNDSVFSDLPSPSDMNSGAEVRKRDSKHRRKISTGSSVWNNVIVATPQTIDESRNDVLFLPEEEEEEEEDVDQNELFEDELRASVLSTKITVNASDADLKDTSAPPLAFFHSDSLHKHRSVDSEKRDSYIPSALFTESKKPDLKKTAAKSHQRKKSVDDSILDKVITVAKDSEDADEEEDSLFDTVSQLTKDQPFEFESTLKELMENSGAVLDSAVKNIMENTNFAAEKIEETDCNFLTPLGDIAACGDVTQKFWNKDDASIEEESTGPNEKTFVDFGSLDGTKGEKSSGQEDSSVPDTPDETQEILRSLDGNQVEELDEEPDDESNEAPEEDDDDASQHVVVCKLSKDGIASLARSLVKSDNGILISRIDTESDLAASGLKPSMTLLTVNGSLCPNTVPDTVLMIKSTSGDVEVTAAFRGAKLSISPAAPHRGVAEPSVRPMREVVDVDEDNVTSPEPSSGFANFFRRVFCGLGSTDIMEDDEPSLETEKRETEEKSISETTENVSESSPEPEKPMRTLTFRVQRLSWQDPIGVKLKRGKGGIVVAEIMKNSPFRFTGLRPGMRIHEINGIGCPGSLIVAENLLKGIENDVELVVTREEKKPDSRPVPVLFYSDI